MSLLSAQSDTVLGNPCVERKCIILWKSPVKTTHSRDTKVPAGGAAGPHITKQVHSNLLSSSSTANTDISCHVSLAVWDLLSDPLLLEKNKHLVFDLRIYFAALSCAPSQLVAVLQPQQHQVILNNCWCNRKIYIPVYIPDKQARPLQWGHLQERSPRAKLLAGQAW